MRFTVTPAAGVGLLIGQAAQQAPRLAPLGKVRREADGRVTGALTLDEAWIFEEMPDGTWSAGHLPTQAQVKDGLGSLEECRAWAASGEAQAALELIGKNAPEGQGQ